MINTLAKITAWLGQHMFFIVLSGLIAGFFIPLPDSPALRAVVVGAFAYTTFVTALGTSIKEFFRVLKRPVIPLWILVLIHGISPFIAWLTGQFFFNDNPDTQLGYLVGAFPYFLHHAGHKNNAT